MSVKDTLENAQAIELTKPIPDGENADYHVLTTKEIDGKALNYPVNIERDGGNTIDEHIEIRETIKEQCRVDRKLMISQSLANYRDPEYQKQAVEDVTEDKPGEFELRRRLRRQYGPGYRAEPTAIAIMDSFYGPIFMDQDLEVLKEFKDAGKDVVDLLNPDKQKRGP
jgi:hypothetical protein